MNIENAKVIEQDAGVTDLRISSMVDVAWWVIGNLREGSPEMYRLAGEIIKDDNDLLSKNNLPATSSRRKAVIKRRRKAMTRTFITLLETPIKETEEAQPLKENKDISYLVSLLEDTEKVFKMYPDD
jgi:hypothetical protein